MRIHRGSKNVATRPRRGVRPNVSGSGLGLRIEPLESRALLTASIPSLTSLLTLDGAIGQPRTMDTVPLTLTASELSPATTAGRSPAEIKVVPVEGGAFVPGSYRLIGPTGASVGVTFTRSGDALIGMATLAPGDYALQVHGRGASTGAFEVEVSSLGGGGSTRSSVGTTPDGISLSSLDFSAGSTTTRNGVSVSTVGHESGRKTTSIVINNLTGDATGANKAFTDGQIYVAIYGKVPSKASVSNPSGWSYFDAEGNAHSLIGPNGAYATVPSFTLDQVPPGGVPLSRFQVVNSGQIYVGLGSPVTLPVNTQLLGVKLTSGGHGFTSTPTVSLSGGAVASTSILGNVTMAQLTATGSGYASVPTVTITGGGSTASGATAVATVGNGIVTGITITNPGSNYSSTPTITITGGGGTGATATAVITGGVSTLTVSAGGSGFTTAPAVKISGGGGTGATATANLTNGSVSSFTITSAGTGYTSAPTVYLDSGIGATVSASLGIIFQHSVRGLKLVTPGAGFLTAPNVTITGGGGSGAKASAAVEVTGVAAPAPGNSSDPNTNGYWNFAEFSMDYPHSSPTNLNADLSQVDQIGYPMTLQLTSSGGATSRVVGVFPSRRDLYQNFLATMNATEFLPLLANTGAGNSGYFHIVAPSDYLSRNPTAPLSDYFDSYIAQVFAIGNTQTIVVPVGGNVTYQGTAMVDAADTATGVAALSGGGVGGVNVTNAGSYKTAPAVSITGGGGSGATASATINAAGQVTGVKITSEGSGYTTLPTVTFSPIIVDQFTALNGSRKGSRYDVYSPATPPSPGAQYAPSPTEMVFANDGVFSDHLIQYPDASSVQSKTLGNIENQLVAAMSRGVALGPYSSWTDAGDFYAPGSTANWYAAFAHQTGVTVGGYAYGFPFDDQGGNSTDISDDNPKTLTINVGWKNALPQD